MRKVQIKRLVSDAMFCESYEELEKNETYAPLLPLLTSNTYHITSIYACRKIVRDGFIFPSGHPEAEPADYTEPHYAKHKRYVALFDGCGVDRKTFAAQFHKWASFLSREPASVLIAIDRQKVAAKFKTYDDAKKEVVTRMLKIPYIEVWYPEPLPFSAFVGFAVIYKTRPMSSVHFEIGDEGVAALLRQLDDVEQFPENYKYRETNPLALALRDEWRKTRHTHPADQSPAEMAIKEFRMRHGLIRFGKEDMTSLTDID